MIRPQRHSVHRQCVSQEISTQIQIPNYAVFGNGGGAAGGGNAYSRSQDCQILLCAQDGKGHDYENFEKNKCLAIFIDVKITYCILCSYILSKCISTGLFHKMHFLVTLFHQLITKKAFAVGALLAPGSTVIVENIKLSTYKNIPSCTWHKVHQLVDIDILMSMSIISKSK